MNLTPADYSTIWPFIFLTVWACVLLLVDLFIPKERKGVTALLSVIGLALTLGFTLAQIGQGLTAFNGMVVIDGFAVFVNGLLLVSGLLGVACMLAIRNFSRMKEDAALGLVLGVFFGAGVVLNDFLTSGQLGEASGVGAFLEGNPAAMLRRDVWLIAGILAGCLIACALLYKELRLLCFDAEYASSQGWPVLLLDIILMLLVTLVVTARVVYGFWRSWHAWNAGVDSWGAAFGIAQSMAAGAVVLGYYLVYWIGVRRQFRRARRQRSGRR